MRIYSCDQGRRHVRQRCLHVSEVRQCYNFVFGTPPILHTIKKGDHTLVSDEINTFTVRTYT